MSRREQENFAWIVMAGLYFWIRLKEQVTKYKESEQEIQKQQTNMKNLMRLPKRIPKQ